MDEFTAIRELLLSKSVIIIDAHDTIFKRDLSRSPNNIFLDPRQHDGVVWQLRDGFINFLSFYKEKRKQRIVISSDGDQTNLWKLCERFGINRQIDEIYGYKHIDKYNYLKQLDFILADLAVASEDAIFLGDGRIDEISAQKYGIFFVKIPSTEESLSFSFNSLLPIHFATPPYGLELQNILNIGKVFHNLTTSHLMEQAIQRQEGFLAHLGAFVVATGEHKRHLDTGLYIVKEPSSEARIDWTREVFAAFDPQKFHLLQLRLQAFLQDRELFIQDCYVGAHKSFQKTARIITQTARHSLFARNMFIQASPEQMDGFFPEFTIIHVPYFKAIPELDGTQREEFVILNLLKKTVLVGGTHYSGEIRRAMYMLLGYFLLQEDILPVKCSSNQGLDKKVALYFGEPSTTKSTITLNPARVFLGDAYHGWSRDSIFNLEWGCYEPIANVTQEKNPAIYQACQQYATLLENVELNHKTRRLNFTEPYSHGNARASFPNTHLGRINREGVADIPAHLFILIKDGLGVIPPLVRLSPPQAIVYLLLGYSSEPLHYVDESVFRANARFNPFFKDHPYVFQAAEYALYLWEKMESSNTQCWLLNKSHIGSLQHNTALFSKDLILPLVEGVLQGPMIASGLWLADESMRFAWASQLLDGSGQVVGRIAQETLWPDKEEYNQRKRILIKNIVQKMKPYERILDPPIMEAVPQEATAR